ncbi:ricin-type beta-trefoil lectin domain protein [Streptomyces sp. NPDC091292]|uniref:RICIN domain-containing protein n=1 Tax=Streptomyces sp. NPDC091292 TaxID=3365991 RepID=UPI003805D39C
MPSPRPPRPSYPPSAGSAPGRPDDDLTAILRTSTADEDTHAVAALLIRHWEPVHDYAAICSAASPETTPMLAAAAFRRVLDDLRRTEPALALRPLFLLGVRDLATAWSTDPAIAALLPEGRGPVAGRDPRAGRVRIAENRQLAGRAFRSLSRTAQYLLWHTEVDAEPLSVPAGLLAMENGEAEVKREQARDQFRTACLRAHIDLATLQECRYYNRLLDVPMRRGGPLLPDVEQHLRACEHCRSAAEQLSHFNGKLGVLLAESVLGRGARPYLAARLSRRTPGFPPRPGFPSRAAFATRAAFPSRTSSPSRSAEGPAPRATGAGRHRLLPVIVKGAPRRDGGSHRRDSKTVVAGIGVGSAVLAAAVLTASLWPSGADDAGSGGAAASPGGRPATPPVTSPDLPPASAGLPVDALRSRLRNAAADLCIDVVGGRAESGAGTTLADCSTARTQQWAYEDDGLLRSLADTELCLNSHADDGTVSLGRCAGPTAPGADDVRYDLTVQGRLITRWDDDLAIAPTGAEKGAAVVVKIRDASPEQRWLIDPIPMSAKNAPTEGASPSTKKITDTPGDSDGAQADSDEAGDRGQSEDSGRDTDRDGAPDGEQEDAPPPAPRSDRQQIGAGVTAPADALRHEAFHHEAFRHEGDRRSGEARKISPPGVVDS